MTDCLTSVTTSLYITEVRHFVDAMNYMALNHHPLTSHRARTGAYCDVFSPAFSEDQRYRSCGFVAAARHAACIHRHPGRRSVRLPHTWARSSALRSAGVSADAAGRTLEGKPKQADAGLIAVIYDHPPLLDRLFSDLHSFSLYGGAYRHVNLVYLPALPLEKVHMQTKFPSPKGPAQITVVGTLHNPAGTS